MKRQRKRKRDYLKRFGKRVAILFVAKIKDIARTLKGWCMEQ